MVKVKEIYGWGDRKVYYDLEDDDIEYCITDNPELYSLVAETIRKYHEN